MSIGILSGLAYSRQCSTPIAVRVSRALHPVNVRKMCARAISLARRKSLTIAVISAGVSYAGILFGSEIVNCLAALVALSFVCIADSTQKGGAL